MPLASSFGETAIHHSCDVPCGGLPPEWKRHAGNFYTKASPRLAVNIHWEDARGLLATPGRAPDPDGSAVASRVIIRGKSESSEGRRKDGHVAIFSPKNRGARFHGSLAV